MTNTTPVLLVDDDEDDYLIIRNLLAKIPDSPFRIEWIPDPEKARVAIAEARHDMYLIDYRLGSINGLELLEDFDLVQRRQPFIILTGAGDERVERRAMQMGVADYLVKGSLDTELLSRVLRYSQQRKLSEAQRVQQLIEINRSKDEFIALASHQLRTPATAVKQYVGMILEGYAGDLTPEQEKFLKSAYESNERQIQVVNDILRVAKLDLKKITLKRTEVDIAKLMENITHDMASLLSGRDQKLKLKFPKQPLTAYIDTEYARMALGNIFDNASKYTPPGKMLTVSATSTPVAATGEAGRSKKGGVSQPDQVLISIRDQGVGIAASDIDKLFKKFSRIDNPLSVKVGGTGLGLYWSNEVVQLHGGHIEVVSEPGVGTEFQIYLPTSA